MANIKVKDLTNTQTINTDDEIMVLTNENSNLVQNITVENFITNVISSDSDNVIEQGADGKLFVETPANITGNLSNLTTTNKSTLVGAINEVDGDVGNLTNLTTSVKTNIVNAINSEVSARNTAETNIQNDYNGKIGTLSNLDTTDKSNIVGAINELAAIAEPSLQYETMNNSKALKTGAPSENPIILADIQKYAHSTFDRSKFTVVGSPIITDDGIASGFSSSNYLLISTSALVSVTEFTEEFEFTTNSDVTTRQEILNGAAYSGASPITLRLNTDSKLYIDVRHTDNSSFAYWGSSVVTANTTYKMKFEAKNGVFYWYINGEEVNHKTIDSPCLFFGGSVRLGSNPDYTFLGSFDLKQFLIKAYGVPFFSGNKTGIDTIKPDDYTVVGTPTISADGIASGFRYQANYLTKNIDVTPVQNIIIKSKSVFGSASSDVLYQFTKGTAYIKTQVYATNDNKHLECYLRNSSNENKVLANDLFTGTINEGDKVETYIEISANKQILKLTVNGVNYTKTLDTVLDSSYLDSLNNVYIGSPISGGNYICNGSIDLNAFKIYVDGDLVYQPCLKIPYTESFTGSKVVDAIYRDRVVDAYEQGYPQRFYTLSDTDFTLPMGEIYGDIENCLNVNTATQDEKNAVNGWCVPDYANGVGKVVNTVYQAAKNVYVKIVNNTDGGVAGYIYVGTTNNPTTEIAQWGGNVATANTVYYMIPKGYYYKVSGTGISSITELPFMGE